MSSTVEVGTAKLVLTGDTTGLEVAIDRAKSKQQGLGAVAQAEADKMTAAQRKVVKSLDESIAKVGLDQKQRLQYRVIMQTEGAVRDALLAKINANTAAVTREGRAYEKTVNAVNQYGLTAKQQTAALRQVPAQLTDIFVSLQGGQNPLTVLLQQGGQLRDVFGGAVPAFKALGAQVVSMINPWTVLAAIIGVAAVAYGQFESRQNALNRSLIMTGQQGRATAEDMNAIAASLDNIAGVTAGQASDALAQVIASGKIAANQWGLVTQAAVTTLNATGKAFKETIAEYEELSRDPISAVLRLNESEHFLTQSVYERIKAMQDAGDIEGAAALATEARAGAQIERAKQIEESLGLISGAWYNIKRSAAEAWDESDNYFTNLDRDAKQAVGTLGRLWASFRMGGVGGAFGMVSALSTPATPVVGDAGNDTVNSVVQKQLDMLRDGNRTAAQRQELEEKQIVNLYRQLGIRKEDKRVQDALLASRSAYERSLPKDKSGTGAARSLANAEASLEIAQIKNQEEAQRNVIQNATKLLQAEYSARIVSADAYYAKQRDLLQQDASAQEKSLTAQIAFLRERNVTGKDSVNVNKQIADLEQRLAKVRADTATQTVILGIQEKELADKRSEAYQDYKYNLDRSVESIKKQVDAQIVAIMYGEREAEKQSKLTEIYDRQTEALRKLLLQKERKEISPEEYRQRVEAENQAAAQSADAVISGYERMKTAQADWLNGLRSGVADWIDQTQNVAQQINQMTTRALDGTVDALTTLFTTGKNTFKELLADIGKELTRFFAKQAVMKFISMFASSFMGGGGDGGSAIAAGGAVGGGGLFKDGAAFTNPTASLSALSGTILTRPTPFLFARGAALGVAGEAGAEAVMPLERGPTGKLGVQMYGGGEGQQFNISITNNIQGNQSQSSTEGDQANSMRAFSENLSAQIKNGIQRSMLPGGDLYAAGVRA